MNINLLGLFLLLHFLSVEILDGFGRGFTVMLVWIFLIITVGFWIWHASGAIWDNIRARRLLRRPR